MLLDAIGLVVEWLVFFLVLSVWRDVLMLHRSVQDLKARQEDILKGQEQSLSKSSKTMWDE